MTLAQAEVVVLGGVGRGLLPALACVFPWSRACVGVKVKWLEPVDAHVYVC